MVIELNCYSMLHSKPDIFCMMRTLPFQKTSLEKKIDLRLIQKIIS